MGITFKTTPAPFGIVHFSLLAAILFVCAGIFLLLRKKSPEKLIRFIFITGLCMVLAEIWKQWFLPRYADGDGLLSWFCPWQLCSMAMYCAVLLPFLKGKAKDAVLVFLSSYSFVAALAALIYPADMMRPQIWLFCHSFLYHTAMIWISLAAFLLLMQTEHKPFLPAVFLFLAMALIAEGINVLSHHVIADITREANMFYITPFYPSTQPVFSVIARKWGILPEIFFYLFIITMASYGMYRLEAKILYPRKK